MSVLRFHPSFCFALLALACASPARDEARSHGRVIDVDDFGDTLRVPAAPPRRMVSLNPTTTEIVFAIGAGARLVGRSHWDSWPDSARRVPDLGPAVRPNVEAVLAAHPDLVLLYASADDRPAATRLREAGVPVVALRVDRIEDFRRATRDLGLLLGDSARATTVIDSVQRTLDRVREATRALDRPTVFMETWDNPVIAIGGGSFINQLIEIAGGRNIYGDVAAPSPTVSLEDVVRRDPDVVLASPVARARLLSDPRWQALRAVREGRVLAFDTTVVGRPSVVLGQAALAIARLLHRGALP
jgi:ABC-type Fe3+-hydroxamate transport system substrate-binding protein